MSTIRERINGSLVPGDGAVQAARDRRALLAAGDALSSAMLDEAEHGADPDEDCPICAALARWKAAAG
jgi:predicted heme/steroid binding protein